MLKLKMMLCVMMLPLVVVGCTSQSVSQQEATTASGVDNAASPRLVATPLNGDYFTLREEAGITVAKTTGRNLEVMITDIDRVAHIDGQLTIIVSNTHGASSGV